MSAKMLGRHTGITSQRKVRLDKRFQTVNYNSAIKLCAHCGGDVGALFVPLPHEYFPYIPPGRSLCGGCLYVHEKEFVEGLKDDDLPVWIGHDWAFDDSERLYKERLEKYLGVKA